MKIIYKIYKKLLSLYKKNYSDNTLVDTKKLKYNFGISILVTHDNQIDILCDLPDVDSLDKNQLIQISEKYAEILLYMNKGLFKNQIFQILTNHSKISENTNIVLFINNIISFYKLLNTEYIKIRQKTNNKPLIRPSSVFKIN